VKSLLAYGYAFLVSSVIHLAAVWAGETIFQAGNSYSLSETPAAATCLRLDLILTGDTRPVLKKKASSSEQGITAVGKTDSGVYQDKEKRILSEDKEEPQAASDEEVGFSAWQAGGGGPNRYLKPRPVQEIKSIYPLEARMREQEGFVNLKVSVDATGGIEKINLVRSCGFSILDQAALEAVKNTLFAPAFYEGKPVAGQVIIRIDFRLNDKN
jgi:TonB family protein